MSETTKAWIKGIAAAVISGAASSVATMIAVPETFNLGSGLRNLGTVALVAGLFAGATYLMKSPLPGVVKATISKEVVKTETVTKEVE